MAGPPRGEAAEDDDAVLSLAASASAQAAGDTDRDDAGDAVETEDAEESEEDADDVGAAEDEEKAGSMNEKLLGRCESGIVMRLNAATAARVKDCCCCCCCCCC